jgi:hypothetical protein
MFMNSEVDSIPRNIVLGVLFLFGIMGTVHVLARFL